MKTKTFFAATLLFAALAARSQITYSITIPEAIPNYDGTYDNFGQAQLYYPHEGEIRFADEAQSDAGEIVRYYTMNTYPKRYLLYNNNIALTYVSDKDEALAAGVPDSLHRIDLEWVKSNTSAFLAKVDEQDFAKLNYFTQWFSSAGRTDVKGSAAIACQSVYPNIDLVYTSNNAGLVMYFIVYPGGDYNDIVMHINGSKANAIVSGKLKIEANWEYTTLEKPNMYQYLYNSSTNVVTPVTVCNASWQSAGSDTYQVGTSSGYNSSLPLIVQIKQANAVAGIHTPGLKWSTYFGGNQFEFLTRTHSDANDNLFIAGSSSSPNFPQNQGVTPNVNLGTDGAFAKFDAAGVLKWSTFVGGSGNEEIHDFDFNGTNITCVGKTSSNNLSTKFKVGATNDTIAGGSGWDGFIFEINSIVNTGVVLSNWLTYFGGNGDEELNACKFDANGNLFVVGDGVSTDMTPMGPGGSYQQNFNSAQLGSSSAPLSTDALIAKFNTSSTQMWFTFFGTDALSTNAHNNAGDYFYGLAIGGTDVYACGKAGGTNLPANINSKMVSGNFDGILANFTTAGALNKAKYTDGNISNYAVKERWGDVYTVGQANSSMNPVNSGIYYYNNSPSGSSDACFSIHSQDLSTTIHNSYIGGDEDDAAYDIQFTSNGLFYVAGGSNSSDFPTNNLATMFNTVAQPNGGVYLNDNFITCFEKYNTNITWSTYLGSSYQESLQYPIYFNSAYQIANSTIAIDSQNRLHILGSTTSYNTFPLDDGAGIPYFQPVKSGIPSPGGTNEGTVTRFDVAALNTIVGIKDFENTDFVFGVYPNPTSNTISITNKAIANDDLRYAVYDMSGKKLKAGNLKADDVKNIDVTFLSQGIYVINVTNGKKTFSNKFVKVDN